MFFFRLHFIYTPLLLVIVFGVTVLVTMPPNNIRIEAGPKGGFFDSTAHYLKEELGRVGVEAEVVNVDDTTNIVKRLNAGDKDAADLGFVAQELNPQDCQHVTSLGAVMIEPLFIFARADSDIREITDMKGKRLAIGPEASGTRRLAEEIVTLFGITEENSKFVPRHATDDEKLIVQGDVDAAFFLLPPETELVQRLGKNPRLHVINLEHAKAVSKMYPYLQEVLIPKGGFSVTDNLPESEITAVALPVTIVAKEGFTDSLAALIALILKERFESPTLVTEANTLPSHLYQELAINPHASKLHKNDLPYFLQFASPTLAVTLWTSAWTRAFLCWRC
ncbi:MAG: hypothetical protein CMJ78_09985 [Planctomycetaceae bacterium]|nr:hypothetical protein [Planctomycetaceae bacterium]